MPYLPRIAAASLAVCLLATGARADSFTETQRREIVAIVRQALKTDPSILSDAILSLRAQEENTEASDSAAAVRRNKAALQGMAGDYVAGNPRGDVTLVEFYDPRCPYCRKMLPDLDGVVSGDNRLRVIEKLIPILGPDSLLEARAIAAAGRQGRYPALQHALMNDSGTPGMPRVRALASAQGLDVARLEHDMADPGLEATLRADVALARSLGISGTPSFVLGGRIIPGAIGPDALRQAIAQARAS